MPLAYDHYYYNNQRLLRAEEKLLDLYKQGGIHSMEEMMECTKENRRAVERMLTSIRRYDGYKVEIHKIDGVSMYSIIYNPNRDPWSSLAHA